MEISRPDDAAARFMSGFNCAQSVLSVFAENYGLEKELALKLASGMGTGFRLGEICGAASGAALVIGLKDGQSAAEDKLSKQDCYDKITQFMARFREVNRNVACRELLGYDLSSPAQYAQAKALGLFDTTCVDLIRSSVGILEEMGY